MVSASIGYGGESGPILTPIAFTCVGFLGGWLRQRTGNTKLNIEATNGVIHVPDRVITPE